MQFLQKQWKSLLSIGLSFLVLYLFVLDANKQNLWELLRSMQWHWLLLALFVKSLSLSIHEYRLWLGFSEPRPPIYQTMQIGFASALINIVLPGRAGDIAAITMLNKRCGVPMGVATFAVGMCGFFEGVLFGTMMLGVLLWKAPLWIQFLGADLHLQSLQTISGLTLIGILIVLVATLIGQRISPDSSQSERDFSPIVWLKEAFNESGRSLGNLRYIVLNATASFIEVWLMIAAFAMGFEILHLESSTLLLSPILAWSLSGLVLGLSAIASIVLPPTYGAGSAAASVFILELFGFNQTEALGFATTWWLISQVPTVLLGLPALWLSSAKQPPSVH